MDFSSPRNLMTTLLGETRNSLIKLIKAELEGGSEEENKQFGDLIISYGISRLDHVDLIDILKFIWSDWNSIKEKIFTCDRTNTFGAVYRNYVGLMMTARNDWAHNYTYTYEDVLHNCFVIQKFFKDTKTQVDISVIDEIVETCFQEINRKQTTHTPATLSIATECEKVPDSEFVEEQVERDENVLEGDSEEVIKGDKITEDELEPENLEEEQIEFEDEEDEAEVEVEKQETEEGEVEEKLNIDPILLRELNVLRLVIEAEDYQELKRLIGFRKEPTVEDGINPDTLYITAEGPTWGSWGYEKLKLIQECLFEVAVFALHGIIFKGLRGEWKGSELICLPSANQSHVQFGKNKARMFCASMDKISVWLSNYY